MLTPPEVARRLGVNPDKVRAWIAAGELRAVNVAQRHGLSRPRWRVDETDLEAFKSRRLAEPAKRPTRSPKVTLDCPDYCGMILRGERI